MSSDFDVWVWWYLACDMSVASGERFELWLSVWPCVDVVLGYSVAFLCDETDVWARWVYVMVLSIESTDVACCN